MYLVIRVPSRRPPYSAHPLSTDRTQSTRDRCHWFSLSPPSQPPSSGVDCRHDGVPSSNPSHSTESSPSLLRPVGSCDPKVETVGVLCPVDKLPGRLHRPEGRPSQRGDSGQLVVTLYLPLSTQVRGEGDQYVTHVRRPTRYETPMAVARSRVRRSTDRRRRDGTGLWCSSRTKGYRLKVGLRGTI